MSIATPPHWDLSNVYPGLDSQELSEDFQKLRDLIQDMEAFLTEELAGADAKTEPKKLAQIMGVAVERFNTLFRLSFTIRAYINSFVSTDSFNQQAMRMNSEYEQVNLPLRTATIQFESWIGKIGAALAKAVELDERAKTHAFYLSEASEQSRYLMSQPEEFLSTELHLSGAGAWAKLQRTVTSQLSVDFELDGQVQKLSMPALINLHGHPDETVRRRAYEAELKAWETVREPLAAALNGIKGTVNTLNKHRGRIDALHPSIDTARIDRETLEALLSAMHDSFPMFHRYFHAKAARLGKERLAWWDLFAPLGKTERSYTFEEARQFILENFAGFSPDLVDLAKRAFDHNWIDAEQRIGKAGGAFCMGIPGVKESRILCNFDGSLDQVATVAHELGHAFHNNCMYKAGKTELQRITPMTMAETASILCETIITEASLAEATDPQEELAILETSLIGSAQVIVDIYSRYLFEKEVFERRSKADLSADELCEIMEWSQKATYGDGLDERHLHKYMWTWKPHYYNASLSFYNYPYAFGLLFGTGLYAIYQQRGAEFVPNYTHLLASTGEAKAAELAARFGIDIRTKDFWASSLRIIGKRIDRYENI